MLSVSTSRQSQPYHHGELKPALLAAAAQLLDEGGAALISLREVARRAGVSHNAPYRHFADRDSLLAALAEDGFRELGRRMDAEAGGLAALGQCYVHFALEQPGRAVHETAPAREPEVATLAAWSLVHGLAQLLLDRQLSEAVQGGLSAAELSERVTRMFVDGLQGG
jgi:AcrR family transcriptional regulator